MYVYAKLAQPKHGDKSNTSHAYHDCELQTTSWQDSCKKVASILLKADCPSQATYRGGNIIVFPLDDYRFTVHPAG